MLLFGGGGRYLCHTRAALSCDMSLHKSTQSDTISCSTCYCGFPSKVATMGSATQTHKTTLIWGAVFPCSLWWFSNIVSHNWYLCSRYIRYAWNNLILFITLTVYNMVVTDGVVQYRTYITC